MINDLKPYPAYKDSGVPWLGKVPKHWEMRRLRTVVEMRVSNVDKHSKGDEKPVRLCNYVDVYKHDKIRADMNFMWATASDEEIERFRLQPGDVLITKDSEMWNDIAVPALVETSAPDLISGYHLALLRPRQPIQGAYLFRAFQSPGIAYQFHVEANGVTRFGLSHDAIKSALVPLPPLPEQTAIVRFLDYMDRRIRRVVHARQRQIKLLEEYRQALIHQAVTGQIDVRTGKPYPAYKDSGVPWLGQVPEHWEVQKLKYAVKFVGGGTPSKTNPSFWEGQIPWVSPKDMKTAVISNAKDHINDEAVAASSTSIVGPGSVLLVVRSGILRRSIPVAINLVPVALNQDMKALRPKHALLMSGYLRALIQGNQRRLLDEWTKQGATVESIEHEYLANSHIPLPPLPEQTAIVEYLDAQTAKIDTAIASLRRKIELVREYRERLIADVVTGKVDVREVAARLPEEPQLESELTEIEVPEGNDDDTIASSDVSWET